MSGSGEGDAGGGGGAGEEGCSGARPTRTGWEDAGAGGGWRGTKIGGCCPGRGPSRLTGEAASRPGLWPDDEEHEQGGERALWLDERAAALCSPRAVERAAAEEEEEPVVESAALCGEGGSVSRMRRAIDSDHLSEKPTENP